MPEYRKLGDLDLYINEPKALEKAQVLLEAQGYKEEKELSDHHVTYRYTFPKTGRSFLLELHYRVWWACISMSRPTRPWMKSIPPEAETDPADHQWLHLLGPSAHRIRFLHDSPYAEALSLQRLRHPSPLRFRPLSETL
ncbi:MAG: nucleotidyltransferase family protein [Lachnospiraceae bacterium]